VGRAQRFPRQRAGRDRKRHREKCREAIRKGLARLVAEQDIIGADRKGKKASFRIRAFPEFDFRTLYSQGDQVF